MDFGHIDLVGADAGHFEHLPGEHRLDVVVEIVGRTRGGGTHAGRQHFYRPAAIEAVALHPRFVGDDALAQSDVGVAMNTGTQAAREAGNMVDLDSDPTKLIEIVGLGKQLLMTRGALTTFSIANDVAKYFAILPAIFIVLYPELGALNVMRLGSPKSAILSAIIFNALIIPCLVPLALKGVKYRPAGAGVLLSRNLAVYGAGGIVAPFIGIKLVDLAVTGLHLA